MSANSSLQRPQVEFVNVETKMIPVCGHAYQLVVTGDQRLTAYRQKILPVAHHALHGDERVRRRVTSSQWGVGFECKANEGGAAPASPVRPRCLSASALAHGGRRAGSGD